MLFPGAMQRAVSGAALAAVVVATQLTAGCASVETRPDRSTVDLVAARHADFAARAAETRALMERLVKRAESKVAAYKKAGPGATPPTIDVLVISGGGDWGAFGAGVLKGWGRVTGELARPQFDVVTGVSTGALIAPFAFLGDDPSLERIVQLYRNPQKDVVVSRGMLFFLPNNPSFYLLPGLERDLRAALDRPMIERIAAAAGTGRELVVNTTNIDLGDMHAWDIVAEAKAALASNDVDRLHRILLASAGIPGIFPARGIGDFLYIDGAITGNILYGGRAREEDGVAALWRAKHPGVPMPRLRYWVIFNNQFRFPPQVTQERWFDIMGRATIMATQTSTMNSMRHLFAMAEIAKLKRNVEMEVRVMAVPDEWVPPKPGTFVAEVMNNLADLGEQMGANPASWLTEPP
ncbi:MAG TPA: patatin-like phospholipase family protein [Burkholderiales bacterium]|nr:patatin-like phospholipase family protein [Burkholderiales bacterium]